LLKLSWPAVEARPAMENELRLQRGARFHRLVHQHQIGVPLERLTEMTTKDETLSHWWNNYLRYLKTINASEGYRHSETTLSTSINGYLLVAKFDLLVIKSEEQVTIFDWKTSRKTPSRGWLKNRIQTRLYPYLVIKVHLNEGKSIQPRDVKMIYWFPNFPNQQVIFEYDSTQYAADNEYLSNLINQIENMEEGTFALTDDLKKCRYCVYRSLCNRGDVAGLLDDIENQFEIDKTIDFDINFEQIAEIEY